jgi:activator of HSP90 ATPase
MNTDRDNPKTYPHATARRQLLTNAAVLLGGLAIAAKSSAITQQPAMKEAPINPANQKLTALHQEISLKATPQRIYEIFLDSRQFAAFSGMPADIDPKAGGTFTMFSKMIEGRNIELVENQRIVQAWRPAHWDKGIYSIAKFELKPQGSDVIVVLDHSSFPEGDYDHLLFGWNSHYWEPMKKYLSQPKN